MWPPLWRPPAPNFNVACLQGASWLRFQFCICNIYSSRVGGTRLCAAPRNGNAFIANIEIGGKGARATQNQKQQILKSRQSCFWYAIFIPSTVKTSKIYINKWFNCSIIWVLECFFDWLFDTLIDCSFDWFIDCLTAWLFDGLISDLIAWLLDCYWTTSEQLSNNY